MDIGNLAKFDAKRDPVTRICLIVAATLLISFGALGNSLVCWVVSTQTHMRTPRNIFIVLYFH